jgi:hypothetical protein
LERKRWAETQSQQKEVVAAGGDAIFLALSNIEKESEKVPVIFFRWTKMERRLKD